MKNRLVLGAMIAVLSAGAGRVMGDDWNGPAADADGSIALADHLESYAHQTLRADKLPPDALELSAALYRAAAHLDPTEPRILRALADNLLELKDGPGAIEVLSQYRKLEPDDQTAQVQEIDLYLASDGMQSADQRLKYLRWLLKQERIPAAVRSEVAERCARIYSERAQDDQSLKMLNSALELNPANLDALLTKYAMTETTVVPIDRVVQLLAILQANPSDPRMQSRLADQLARLGLVQESATWYSHAYGIYNAQTSGGRADPAFALGASSEWFIANHIKNAASLIASYVKAYPEDTEGWFLQLAISKYQAGLDAKDENAQSANAAVLKQAAIALTNRLQEVRSAAGDATATTRPINSSTEATLPDLTGDVSRLKSADKAELNASYVNAANSLAWFDLYYRHDGEAAGPLLDVLGQLLPSKNADLTRLQAWRQFVAGDTSGALVKFEAAGDRDPFSSLGAFLIDASESSKRPQALIRGQKLLNMYPSGPIGAVVWGEVSKLGLETEASPSAPAVTALIENVPRSFVEIVNDPQTFYVMSADPLQASYEFGQPILVRVSLTNISDQILAIGDNCALHPELWFDAFLRGMLDQGVTGAAIGRLDQRLALAPGQSVSTVLRVDQDALYSVFNDHPDVALTVNLTMVTNPTDIGSPSQGAPAQARPGLCGSSVQLNRMIEQDATPITTEDQRQQLVQRLSGSDGGEKIRTMQAMEVYIASLRQKGDTEAVAEELLGHLRTQDYSAGPCVQAWQKFELATLALGNDQIAALNAMAQDSAWQTRLLGLLAAEQTGQNAPAMANQLLTDKNSDVRAYAKALASSPAAGGAQAGSASPPAAPTDAPKD